MKLFEKVFFFLSFTLACFAADNVWVLDQTILESSLQPEISIEEISKILENEGIQVVLQRRDEAPLWQGNKVAVFLARAPFAPYHLWIEVQGCKRIEECTGADLDELYQAISIARQALIEAAQAEAFMIFATEGPRRGKTSSWVGVEIIPIWTRAGVMDAAEKVELDQYILYNAVSSKKVVQSPEIIDRLRAQMNTPHPMAQSEQSVKGWTQKVIRSAEAVNKKICAVYKELNQLGALIEGELPQVEISDEKVEEFRIHTEKCPFCNPKIIQKEVVCEWRDVFALMNHKPFSRWGSFLIFPKRHQFRWDLTPEEARATFEVAIALKQVLCKKAGSDNWVLYVQDGPAAWQSVPHTHMHLYIISHPLERGLTGLQYSRGQLKALSEHEMKELCEDFRQPVLDQLKQ